MTASFCILRGGRVAAATPALALWMVMLTVGAGALRAEGLKSAQVSRIFNEVKLLPENQPPRAAAVSDMVTGKAAVQTGAASRTELMFSDKTLTRLGANSFFSFVNGTRDMNLGSGTMLLQVPKGAGGAEVHTAAVTAAITGTTLMVEYDPKSYSKLVVLEGTVRVSLTGHLGESVLVHAGQILIVPAKARELPEPVAVNLTVLYASSGLIRDFGPLASTKLINGEMDQQRKALRSGKLESTPLFIAGSGTDVQSRNLSYTTATDERITAQQGEHSPVPLGTTSQNNPTPTPVPSKYGALGTIAGNGTGQSAAYQINNMTAIRTDPYTTNGVQDAGSIYRGGTVTFDDSGVAVSSTSTDGLPSTYLLGAPSTLDFLVDPATLQQPGDHAGGRDDQDQRPRDGDRQRSHRAALRQQPPIHRFRR